MQLFFKEEINIYRKLFSRESKKSVSAMEILDEFVQKIHESAMNATNIHDIQRAIRLLSIFCDILQTFNSNIETLVSSIDEHIFKEVMARSPNSTCLRVKDWLADLSPYKIGDKFTGVISYILDGDTKLCFIKDQTRNKIQDFKEYLESAFEGIPNYGHVFALELNHKFFRAIRIESEPTNSSIRVRLIDIGETISVSPNGFKYNLIEKVKNLPPMAILCRVEKFDGAVLNSLNTLYKRVFEVKIENICVNMLEVELCSEMDNGIDEMNESIQKSIIDCMENSGYNDVYQQPLTPIIARSATVTPNPFLVEFPDLNNHRQQIQTPVPNGMQTPIMNGKQTPNNYSTQSLVSNSTYNTPMASTPPAQRPPLPPIPPRQRPQSISPAHPLLVSTPKALAPIRIPINIVRRAEKINAEAKNERNTSYSNSVEDVVSSPNTSPEKNEIQINGAHPKTPKIEVSNGYSYKAPVREPLPKPSKGEEKAVTPTHIIGAEYMYVQLNDWYHQFQEFQTSIQSLSLKQLSYIPKPNDFVLARYDDGLIYRARVEKIDQRNVEVFYLDYGNTESVVIDALFEWDTVCNAVPLQAIQCRLANIRQLPGASISKIYTFICEKYLNKACKAYILDISDDTLLVKLTNPYGRDVIEEIKEYLFPECIV